MKDKLAAAINWLKDKYVSFANWSDANPKKAKAVRVAAIFAAGFVAGAVLV